MKVTEKQYISQITPLKQKTLRIIMPGTWVGVCAELHQRDLLQLRNDFSTAVEMSIK